MKTRSIAAFLFLIIFLAGMAPAARAASSTVTTISASADTYVDSAKPTANFGGIVTMWIRGGTPTRRGLLRFDLSAIPANAQISSAILNLAVSSDGSSVAGTVNAVSGTWAENTVTYTTAPQAGGSVAALRNPASPNSTVTADLTAAVAGKTVVNFYIVSSNSDGVVYYTHEKSASLAPRLVVTWSTSSGPTSTPTARVTSTPSRTAVPTTPSVTGTVPLTKTATPTRTSTPVGDSLALPLRLAFYYPWFPERWTQAGDYPFTNYNPSLGFYDSSSLTVIQKHIADMQYAGIQGGIASWGGQGSATDARIATLLSAAAGGRFKWTLYYEAEGTSNPTTAAITADLAYIYSKYSQNQNYLRIGGKPVLFVYADASDGCGMVDRWKAANTSGFYLVLKVFGGYATCANQPNNWHQYGPASNYDVQGSHAISISPGYWRKGQTALLKRDLARWNQDVANMVKAGPDLQLITTWNQWGDGTFVESSVELGRSYLDALHNNGQTPPTPQPTNTPPVGTDPSIMAAGDIICDSLVTTSIACQQMAVSQLLVDQHPDAALVLGDLCHTPAVDCFNNYYNPAWGRLFSISRPAPGNHDYIVPAALYYFDYWNGIGNVTGPAGNRTEGYYSFELGTWHLIALNSNCGDAGGCNAGSPQYTWLQQDLQKHPNACTLAFYHIPVFSSGGRAEENMRQVYTLLYNNGVDVVLDGHDHIYERFAPQDPNGLADPVRGIREFIVGTGGANHTVLATVQPNSEVRNADTFGALKLTLHAGRYDWQFMPMAGQSFTDSGSGLCH